MTDDGYLWDPNTKFGSVYNPDVVSFESVSRFSCLALLGEPGMGKSTAIQAQKQIIDAGLIESNSASLWVDLRAYQSDVRLVQGIFQDPIFRTWLNGNHPLHLFLDSLDECLLRIGAVAALLIEEFGKYPIDRLYLRIACRTADWPASLEEGLRRLWGEEQVKVFELAPLCRADVIEAAKTDGLDADTLLTEIDKREVVPLAVKPVTLRFLLNLYSQHGEFPSGQNELYWRGCRLLCEETSDSRRAAQLTGALSAQQRLAVATRIAALTIFTNRHAIWTSFDAGDVRAEDITISDLCGGKESLNGEEVVVSETAIREVLATGLFSSRGTNRMGWAHQTYAEFLAARYLLQRHMTLAQVASLIVHPNDPDRKLIPQLHETAAWLAGMMPQVFRAIMQTDPEVLLKSDIATADVKDRAALVETLLNLSNEERLLDRDFGIRKRYMKLVHPTLSQQLEPFIRDRTRGNIARRVAVDIAEACRLRELLPSLVDLALDSSESLLARVNAAHAVLQIDETGTRAKLKSLAKGDAGDDPYDELKGCGLKAVWPSRISVSELFSLLTPPKQPNFVGAYHLFIVRDLPRMLQPSHIPEALRWAEAQESRHTMPSAFRKLLDAIMTKGWEHLHCPGVVEAFAKAAFSRIKHYEGFVEDTYTGAIDTQSRDNELKRHQLLETMVTMMDSEEKASEVLYSHPPIVLSQDLSWIIERLHSSSAGRTKKIWSRIISRSFDRTDSRQIDAVLVACDIESALAEEMAWLLKPVELGSPEAEKMKAEYLERQKWERDDRKRPLLDPPPGKRIEKLLDDYESGDHSAWWRINLTMTLRPNSTHYDLYKELEPDLQLLPGWKMSTPETKQRIMGAAKTYLSKHDPETEQWLGTNTIYRPDFAGYKAFRLLLREDPNFLYNLPTEVWRKWAPIILAYPCENAEAHQELIKSAYSFAPDEILETLSSLIDRENKEMSISITDKVKTCWDDRLAALLLRKVQDAILKPESMRVLLEDLIEHGVQEAEAFAKSLVSFPLPPVGDERSRAIVAAKVLVSHAKDAGWEVVWPAMQNDPEFGREIVTSVAGREGWSREGGIWEKINDRPLADLFIWLAHKYPYSEDPEQNGSGRVTPRETIAHWRDAILHGLKLKGTRQACDEIRRISQEFPELPWLKWTLMDAENHARRHSWVPVKPSVILGLADNQDLRVVQSGNQLLDVVIDSLKRLEAKLQGETPIAQFLWEGNKATPRPRDESSFCDFIKWQLEEDLQGRGIIINREVQIHRGQRTDIYVNAVVCGQRTDTYDSLALIVEAKGCWHAELENAMESQLLGQYLQNNPCGHGLYLVGWFDCDRWDNTDYRKQEVPKLTLKEAQRKFDAQALELSRRGKLIKAFVINATLS